MDGSRVIVLVASTGLYRYDTLSVNVEFGGQNWPNIKWALQGFSGVYYVFFAFLWLKKGYLKKKLLEN